VLLLFFRFIHALATLLFGSLTSCYVMLADGAMAYWGNPIIPAVLCATAGGMIVSLLTPRNTVSHEEACEILAKERDMMEMGDKA